MALLGVLVALLSVAEALETGDLRFLLGTALGGLWVVLATTGWGLRRSP